MLKRPIIPLGLILINLLNLVRADADLDASRNGELYTEIPIYRSGSGTNVVKVKVGNPATEVQLTVSTNVNFVQVASDQCTGCAFGADLFNPSRSSSWTSSDQTQVNVIVFPQVPEDTLTLTSRLGTDILLDPRYQDKVAYPVSAVDQVQAGRDAVGGGDGQDVSFGRGVAGFYGLGIYQENRQQSIFANMLNADNYPPNQPVPTNFIIGFDIGGYNSQAGSRVGNLHWGAAPQGRWVGDFNWIETNRTVAGSWGLPIENIRMGGNVVDTTRLYASLDPGFDGIFVPNRVAEQLFTNIQGVRRDPEDPRRWTIPCNFIQSMSLSLQSATYNFNPTQLVQARDTQARTCWSQVQAWTNGSVAEEQGEIRLGTSFLSGVYSTIYYSPNQQFVGLAGKPGSVNDYNVADQGGRGMPNKQLAGILIGTLFATLLILFIICYARNRSTFQSVWARGTRRMQRAQMNAVIRGTTIPPPMAMAPGMMPMTMGPVGMPMGMGPMGMGMGPMAMGPMGPMRPVPMGPGGMPIHPQYSQLPMYQGPAQQSTLAPISQGQQRHQSLPAVLPHQPQGYYSPRTQRQVELAPPPSNENSAHIGAASRRKRDRHSAPVPPRKDTEVWTATSEQAGYRHQGGSSGRDGRVKRWSRNIQPSDDFARTRLPPHPEERQPRGESKDRSQRPHRPTKDHDQIPQLYDPPSNHRFSRPEYEHAPPGSATSKSLWNFGKPKPKSTGIGYEAVPRHTTKYELSGGEVPPVQAKRDSWFGREGSPRWMRRDRLEEADIGDGARGDWKTVERNREMEGLTAAGEWRK